MNGNERIQPMTDVPTEITYEVVSSPYGLVLVAVSQVGPCLVTLIKNEQEAVQQLTRHFPSATPFRALTEDIKYVKSLLQASVLPAESILPANNRPLVFHLKGTAFQLKVWRALLDIPLGQTVSYAQLAKTCGHPNAYRAVGTAVGMNPIVVLIPCHRVICSDGRMGWYHWGSAMKQRLLIEEGVVINASV